MATCLLLQRPTDGLPGDLAFQAQDLSEMTMPRFNSCSFTGRRDDHEISPSCSLVCTVAVSLAPFFYILIVCIYYTYFVEKFYRHILVVWDGSWMYLSILTRIILSVLVEEVFKD